MLWRTVTDKAIKNLLNPQQTNYIICTYASKYVSLCRGASSEVSRAWVPAIHLNVANMKLFFSRFGGN